MRKLFNVAVNNTKEPVYSKTKNEDGSYSTWYCPAYKCWHHMIERCYSERSRSKYPTYADCTVCDDWLMFGSFRNWYYENAKEGYQLDKDLLSGNSKVYSPETCTFIHQSVNKFLIDCSVHKSDHLNGASLRKDNGRFRSRCCNPITGRREHLGNFKLEVDAHLAWANRKKEVAIMLANSDFVDDNRVRNALMSMEFRQV